MEDEYETVHTVTDWYDGPHTGVADFRGTPHIYQAVFDDDANDWSPVFLLQPIDERALALAREDWRIWQRWEQAYHRHLVGIETHPALPEDRERHDQLQPLLTTSLELCPTMARRAKADFRVADGVTQVKWTLME